MNTSKSLISSARERQRLCSFAVGVVLAFVMFGCGARAAYGDWTNVWSDEFNGTSVDLTKWTFDTGNGGSNPGWGNNELEYYTSRTINAYVTNGLLHIRAQLEVTNSTEGTFNYTSARLKTRGLFWKKYGWIEFRAKLPQGVGFWPATWMLGTNFTSVGWPACGEIDVMENDGADQAVVGGTIIHNTLSSPGTPVYQTKSYTLPTPGDSVANFHTYAIQWSTNSIIWLVDNVSVKTWTSWTSSLGNFPAPFDRPFFLLMNLAVGGNYVGNPSPVSINPYMPGEMQVDYVRVYDGTPPASPPPTPTGLTAIPGNAQVSLSWNGSPNATSYNVKRSTIGGGPYAPITSLAAANYTDTGLTNCATYYYVVSAVNSFGETTNSTEASATPISSVVAVNSGGGAAGQFMTDTSFTGGTSASTGSVINTTGLTNPAPQAIYQTERYGNFTYLLGGLTPGASHTVRLHFAEFHWTNVGQRVFNVLINGAQVLTNFDIITAAGGQNKATIQEFTATANGSGKIAIGYNTVTDSAKSSGIEIILPPLAVPAGLIATAGDSQVTLSWNASAGASGYNVKRAMTGGGPYTTVTNGLTSTIFTNTGLANGTTYYYVISTVKGSCESTNSVAVSVTPVSSLTPFQQWQVQYFGSTTNADAAADADPDGDGLSNTNEFQTGTTPTNSASSFGITLISTEGDDIRVTWMMGSGKTNALQVAPGDLAGSYPTNFTDIFTVTNTVGSTTNYPDPSTATNGPSRYYRVRLVP